MGSICDKRLSADVLPVRLAIRAEVLSHPGIADCAVLLRQLAGGGEELVVYYAPTGPVSQPELIVRLKAIAADVELPLRIVSVHKIPLKPDGMFDDRALASIPVLDEDCLDRGRDALRARFGVSSLALVREERGPQEPPPYHLSDLIPRGGRSGRGTAETCEEALPSGSRAPARAIQPSLLSGPDPTISGALTATTLVDVFEHALEQAKTRCVRFIAADGEVVTWDYAKLGDAARRICTGLCAEGLEPGRKVVLQLRTSEDILSAFWGCQLGGFVPIILEVPASFDPGGQALDRLLGLLQRISEPVILADAAVRDALLGLDLDSLVADTSIVSIDAVKSLSIADFFCHRARPDDIALINLSSGSTGIPKCIMLSHRNLIARAAGTNQLCPYSSEDVILNWLPLDHIGSISDWHIRCVLIGCTLIYADKDYVLRDPLRWLGLIDRFRVTHSWAPSFAFALAHKRLSESPAQDWDLSCIKGLLTAGEAVSDRSVLELVRAATRYGLMASAIWPAFGMAELGSGVTYCVPTAQRPLNFLRLRPPAFGERAEPVADGDTGGVSFADLGDPIPGASLRIVDESGALLPLGYVGRLQVKGDMVFQGYLGNPEATASALSPDGWLDTGDLGLLWHGRLVLTGREKDTIIVNGANYYCHEIEATAAQVEGVAPALIAACGARCGGDAEEQLALFFVLDAAAEEASVIRELRTRIATRYGVTPTYLLPVEKHQIPKTSIGKIQRDKLRRSLEAGALDDLVKRVDLLLGNASTLPAWFYRTCWVARQVPSAARYPVTGATLVLMDERGLGRLLVEHLESLGRACIQVTPGVDFRRLDGARFEIDLHSKAAFSRLFHRLAADGVEVGEILHLLDYRQDARPSDPHRYFGDWYFASVAALLHSTQALAEVEVAGELQRLVVVGNGCHVVMSDERGAPEKAMVAGFVKSLRAERPTLAALQIDLPSTDPSSDLHYLVNELTALAKEPVVAYRQRLRYVQRLQPLTFSDARDRESGLKSGGRYLITGGLGGVGFELCRRLGHRFDAKLLIIGRGALLEGAEGQASSTGAVRAARYQALLDEGIQCSYAAVDVCEERAVRALVEQTESAWGGTLDGIFHLAGQAHERSTSSETLADVAESARAKTQGSAVLAGLLKDRPRAFLAAFSSVNATFGGSGTGSYSAANAYLEAYCRGLQRAGLRAWCYTWSRWEGFGMSQSPALAAVAATKGLKAIGATDGFHSLLALIGSGQSEAIIGLDASKLPIQSLIADCACQREWAVAYLGLTEETLATDEPPSSVLLQDRFGTEQECRLERVDASAISAEGRIDLERLRLGWKADCRGEQMPRTETEAKLKTIWTRLLGLREIGIEESFFDLGGSSLLAAQLASAIETELGRQLPVSTVFHATTIARLARAIDQDTWASKRLSVVPIKPTGSKLPIFVVQSSSWDLIRHLDPEQPVYGLNFGVGAKTRKDRLSLPTTLAELAAHYVEEMTEVQPRGPYFLVGHSAAGLVAFEMARQLSASGEPLGLVGLVDTYYPGTNRRGVTNLLGLSRNGVAGRSKRWVSQRLRNIATRSLKKEAERPLSMRARPLYDSYSPSYYPGRVSYWKCTKQSSDAVPRTDEEQWGRLAGAGLIVHDLDCNHDEIMKYPHVQTLADQIATYTRNP